ncbi:MAG: HepT-like ribonuclease domain-containing protein [Terriglobia bacterium]
MPPDYKLYLQDILDACGKIQEYTLGRGFESFKSDSKTFDAVLRNLEVIGEAAKNVSQEVRSLNPQIDWKKIAGLRIILAHAYFGVDAEIIWDVVQNELPALKMGIENMISST